MTHRRIAEQRQRLDHRHRIVGRKVLTVVFELDQIQTTNKARRRVARNEVDLPGSERAVTE